VRLLRVHREARVRVAAGRPHLVLEGVAHR
jgi:hypothetical protein